MTIDRAIHATRQNRVAASGNSSARRGHAVPYVMRAAIPLLRHVFADGAYAGHNLEGALQWLGRGTLEIIKSRPDQVAFEVLPRR